MFIRDRQPSETSRKVARGITVGHMAVLVALTALLSVGVAIQVISQGAGATWLWMQVAAIAILFFAILGLVVVVVRST